MSSKTYTVKYRRRLENKTDYMKRLKLLQSGKPRLTVRKSLKEITAQVIQYEEKGDKVIAAARSSSLKGMGWNYNFRNTSSAYLLGLLIAKKAKEKGVQEAILDLGIQKAVPGSRLFAVLKGAIDNGMKIPHSDSVLPSDERIHGKHIETYAAHLGNDKEKKFSGYLKQNADPGSISKTFDQVKNKIIGA